jgi:transcriptional regulator with XRE-family HTH domain
VLDRRPPSGRASPEELVVKIHPDSLRSHRIRSRLTQEALAQVSNVSKKTITRIEAGRGEKVRSITINRLAIALKVEPEALENAPEDSHDLHRR